MPSVAFLADCVSAASFAPRPLATARPVESSAPELMREPEESCCKVFRRFVCVVFRLFCAYSAAMLLKMPTDMGKAPVKNELSCKRAARPCTGGSGQAGGVAFPDFIGPVDTRNIRH